MKILWFEITTPGAFDDTHEVLGGWQDSLEDIVRNDNNIDLTVAFITNKCVPPCTRNGVRYEPMYMNLNIIKKILSRFTWAIEINEYLRQTQNIIEKVSPDIIQVFGCEFPFGLIAKKTKIPVVIHLQGAIIPYHNASYPPGYSVDTFSRKLFPNLFAQLYQYVKEYKEQSRVKMEQRIWSYVHYYMGRTKWDKSLTELLHPGSTYFHVDEALRKQFMESRFTWRYSKNKKLTLLSIGIGTFWKGPDMLIKTARILRNVGIDFEWIVAGDIRNDVRRITEKKEGCTFDECNVNIVGFQTPDRIIQFLTTCNMYVHTAYIDNSPNSICEAQLLGVPIISTNVGGISSLINNNEDGILVPANDPWIMAQTIIDLSKDTKLANKLSKNAIIKARKRHDIQNIRYALHNCYETILAEE